MPQQEGLSAGWSGTPATECTWCGAALDGRAARRFGRTGCPECGASTTDPRPDATALDEAYGDWYWPETGNRFSLVGDALLRRSRASMAARIDEVAPPGPILDVGAGEGTLIDALATRGRKVAGIDRQSGHPEVEEAELSSLEGPYSAIVFWHSLEHLPEPGEAIGQAARLLGTGGVVFIAVPNIGSRQAAAFGDDWLHLDLPRHLNHQTLSSLRSGLEARGFVVGQVSGTRGGQVVIGWLDGLVAKLPGRLSLYQSLRRKSARRIEVSPAKRTAAIAAGMILLPVAAFCAAIEIVTGRSGTVYLEAHRV